MKIREKSEENDIKHILININKQAFKTKPTVFIKNEANLEHLTRLENEIGQRGGSVGTILLKRLWVVIIV